VFAERPLVNSLLKNILYTVLSGLLILANNEVQGKSLTLLNASYDPTREFYRDFNREFSAYWNSKTGQKISVRQSHGGSGKQARSVIDGLRADVVTLALAYDIDEIARKSKRLPANWQSKLPHQSSPYTSTIVFLVRQGNPKNIKDWPDLARPGVQVISPNPKTSGGARWNYLAAWGYIVQKETGGLDSLNYLKPEKISTAAQSKAKDFVQKVFKNVPVLDAGARASANTFIQRGIGDVLITWENEALLTLREIKNAHFEIVVPSVSILAEPPVALIEKNAKRKGTYDAAKAYLRYLYTPKAQTLAAKHFFRPIYPDSVNKKILNTFKPIKTFNLQQIFVNWTTAQKTHFSDGGVFDQIYLNY